MSGALPLTTEWKPFKVDGGANIYMADLSAQAGALTRGIPGLRVDGHRGIRASYPNRDPELTIFPDGWIHDRTHWAKPIPPKTNETFVTVDKPMLHDKTMFQNYMVRSSHTQHRHTHALTQTHLLTHTHTKSHTLTYTHALNHTHSHTPPYRATPPPMTDLNPHPPPNPAYPSRYQHKHGVSLLIRVSLFIRV